MSFFGDIMGGVNLGPEQKREGQLAGYSTGIGEGDTTAASQWYQNILSGDPTKNAQALAPEISAANEGAQQQKKQAAEFGTRSGGTGAALAGVDEGTRAELIKLLGGEKSVAAAGLANLGTENLGMAASDTMSQADLKIQQQQSEMNSILGHVIGTGVGAAESFGLGKAFPAGGTGGGGGMSYAPQDTPTASSYASPIGPQQPDYNLDYELG